MRSRLRSLTARRRLALGAVALILVSAAATTVALATLRSGGDERNAMRGCTLVAFVEGVGIDLGLHLDTPARHRRVEAFEDRLEHHHVTFRIAERKLRRYLGATMPVRRVVVCAAGRCEDVPLERLAWDMGARVRLPHDTLAPTAVTVVIDRRDRPLQVASGIVRQRRSEPNGVGCGYWHHGSARVEGSTIRDTSA